MAGQNVNGQWRPQVKQSGAYEIALRRWPKEADAAITASAPEFGETMQSLKIMLLILLCALTINAQNKFEDKTIASKTAGLQKIDGYIPLYWDAANGKMWMEISRFNTELLYQVSLPAGVG